MAKISAYILTFLFLGNVLSLEAGLMSKVSRLPIAYMGAMALHCGIAHQTALQRLYYMVTKRNCAAMLLNASPEVTQFVLQRMQKHGINHEGIRVKQVGKPGATFSCNNNTIFIRTDIHYKFLGLLLKKEPLNAQEQERLYNYTITIDHEIAHIKNKDTIKDRVAVPILSVGLHALGWVAAKKLKLDYYFRPSYFQQKGNESSLSEGLTIAAASGFGLYCVHRALVNYWICRQEAAADEFSLQKVENPAAFDAYIKHNNKSHKKNAELCAEVAARCITLNAEDITTDSATWLGDLAFKIYVVAQHRYYRHSVAVAEQSTEHFKQWLMRRPSFTRAMGIMCDPTHPNFMQRIERARYYARASAQK